MVEVGSVYRSGETTAVGDVAIYLYRQKKLWFAKYRERIQAKSAP